MSAAPTLRGDLAIVRVQRESAALDADVDGAHTFSPWFALRPSAGAPREPLTTGCVRAAGPCTCEGCTAREADARAMRALVAATMVECGASKATEVDVAAAPPATGRRPAAGRAPSP